MASIEDFKKITLKIARIKEIDEHPDADRLYVLKLETAESEKQVVAGIKKFYEAQELKDKLVVLVDNLDPVNIRGVESQGMILAASDTDSMAIISPEKAISIGATVK